MKFNSMVVVFLFALLVPNLQQATGMIEVKVIDPQGKPVANASVYYRDQAEASNYSKRIGGDADKEGRFVIQNLPPGEFFVDAYKEAEGYPAHVFRFYEGEKKVWQIMKLGAGERKQVTIQLGPKCATLQLTVEDPDSKPTGASVEFTRLDKSNPAGISFGHAMSGYKEYLIPPDVPLRIEVKMSANAEEENKGWVTWRSEPLTVRSEDVLKWKVRFGKTGSTVVKM